ncbi:glycosyl hydrolase family 76-domain-containing protein [Aspergillus minisclerotigenes]|uniref:Mannan endo-1,6-alpha-mannosidase n=1 Tax=Aspergillus minisclerotigenes TaxID=656917 RepID=A0A5N6JI20_9EURO|nr:glycosyl hydrolase family 76-domain-containing protein [Aspergillus minisclerotigenes]
MRGLSWQQLGGAVLLLLQGQVALSALSVQVNSKDSLANAGKEIADPMMDFYAQNQTEGIPGKLTDTWYIAGAMFMTLIQYWATSGVEQYNKVVSHDLMFQSGENYDYFSSNYSQWLGNDDQMFWGLASITASETGFPEVSGKPTWTSLARTVFNMQVERWDETACNGGLRWQIWPYQAGYTMKNSISNGGLFELSARLARFTKNETYAEWAEKIWDWSASSPLILTDKWYVADSTSNENNCKDSGNNQWTYNYGTFLSGAAFMYNYTNGDEKWLKRVNGLLESTFATFFPSTYGGNVLSEVACEPIMSCDRNQLGFKGYTAMWLAHTAILVPSTAERITPKLQGSAEAIAKQCSGESENLCGETWGKDTWDGMKGLEVQMAALGGITSNLMLLESKSPQTIDTNPDAAEHHIDNNENSSKDPTKSKPIETADRAGAWILTVMIAAGAIGAVGWLIKTQ